VLIKLDEKHVRMSHLCMPGTELQSHLLQEHSPTPHAHHLSPAIMVLHGPGSPCTSRLRNRRPPRIPADSLGIVLQWLCYRNCSDGNCFSYFFMKNLPPHML